MHLRPAVFSDIPALEDLIPLSAKALQSDYYTTRQTEGALGTIFAVDRQLIEDGTYFVAEENGLIVGCGGWSYRKTLCGGDQAENLRENTRLDSSREAARIRAFFVHPEWARRGIGKQLVETCEIALLQSGFRQAEILATLAGEPLYLRFGYITARRYDLDLPNGEKLPVVQMLKKFPRS